MHKKPIAPALAAVALLAVLAAGCITVFFGNF